MRGLLYPENNLIMILTSLCIFMPFTCARLMPAAGENHAAYLVRPMNCNDIPTVGLTITKTDYHPEAPHPRRTSPAASALAPDYSGARIFVTYTIHIYA